MNKKTNPVTIICLVFFCLPTQGLAEWFKDPNTGCGVWGEHEQPIVKIYWSGECIDGKASGKGLMEVFIDDIPFSTYEGEYKAGKADGYGILSTPGQSRYEGDFKDNAMHGKGVIISPDGKRIEGQYENNLPHGLMKLTSPGGKTVEVEFEHGKPVRVR